MTTGHQDDETRVNKHVSLMTDAEIIKRLQLVFGENYERLFRGKTIAEHRQTVRKLVLHALKEYPGVTLDSEQENTVPKKYYIPTAKEASEKSIQAQEKIDSAQDDLHRKTITDAINSGYKDAELTLPVSVGLRQYLLEVGYALSKERETDYGEHSITVSWR